MVAVDSVGAELVNWCLGVVVRRRVFRSSARTRYRLHDCCIVDSDFHVTRVERNFSPMILAQSDGKHRGHTEEQSSYDNASVECCASSHSGR